MKVERDNVFTKTGLGLALYCLLVANAFAITVEPPKHEELKLASLGIADSPQAGSYKLDKKTIYHSSEVLPQPKSFALVDSIKEDGQLFFAMRSGHTLASESSAAALLILGFLGFFSRRWL